MATNMQIHQGTYWTCRLRNICLLAAVVLGSCGGGEELGGIQGSGRSSPAAVVGPITTFGSIFVNGVEYATSAAQIRVDGQPSAEAQLRVGQIVTLKGTVNDDGRTGTANEVSFVGDAQGPISDLDVGGSTFVVLGQTVRVTNETRFDDAIEPANIEGLQNGAVVEVSGFANAAGDVFASRIDVKSAAAPLQATGTVQALDTVGRTFRINALAVDYSAVTPVGTLANGITANVRGTSGLAGGPLVATSVEVASSAGAANDVGEVEGFITSFSSNTDFVVRNQRVTTNAGTQRVPAGLVLGLNVAVKVKGTFDNSNVLVADRIEEKREAVAMVAGVVDSVSSANNSLTVLGITVTTSVGTSFEDKSDQKLRPFRLSDVRAGDYVTVRGSQNAGAGPLVATALERERPANTSWLQGVALNVAAPNLTVLGVSAMTNAQTQFVGQGSPQEAEASFFIEAPDHVVKLRGALSGSVFVVDRAQLLQ
jgi:hypothetical protein